MEWGGGGLYTKILRIIINTSGIKILHYFIHKYAAFTITMAQCRLNGGNMGHKEISLSVTGPHRSRSAPGNKANCLAK